MAWNPKITRFVISGSFRYRYSYQTKKWVTKIHHGGVQKVPDQMTCRPDSRSPGHLLMSKVVNFHYVKVINNRILNHVRANTIFYINIHHTYLLPIDSCTIQKYHLEAVIVPENGVNKTFPLIDTYSS